MSRSRVRSAAFVVGFGLVVLEVGAFVMFRFANPDMTDIRALLSAWPLLVALLLGFLLIAWGLEAS
jgi:hypothetical protein